MSTHIRALNSIMFGQRLIGATEAELSATLVQLHCDEN